MLLGATAQFLERACTGDVRVPAVVMDDGVSGYRDGALHLQTADGWGVVARGLVSALFHQVAAGDLAPDSPDLAYAVSVANRYLTVKCANQNCGETLGLPASCPQCFVGIN